MKEYKITYSGESEGYRLITDITEAAAKKYFREVANRATSPPLLRAVSRLRSRTSKTTLRTA